MTANVRFAQVLKQLVDEKYRRNRAALAEQAHVSPSAISQYVTGRSTPSVDVLVQLAEVLDVTLDYLVLGREQSAQPELGYVTGRMEAHIRDTHAQAEALYDLTARIGNQTGTRLGEQLATLVRSVARELVDDGVGLAGTLSPDELVAIERCDAHAVIVTSDLDSDILVLEQEGQEDSSAAGAFAQVVNENIAAGCRYEYIVPNRSKLRRAGALLRQGLVRLGKLDAPAVDRRLQISYVPRACVPGFAVHHVVLEKLRRQATQLLDQIARFIYPDPDSETMGYLAVVTPASLSYQRYILISREEVPHVLNDLHILRQQAI